MVVVHVARINIDDESGMGRVASQWRDSFVKAGHEFYHIGISEVGKNVHRYIWGYFARNYLNSLSIKCDLVLVHEPLAGFFVNRNYKLVVFSHGVEERLYGVTKKFGFELDPFRSQIIPNKLKFWSNNYGFINAQKILLLNHEDEDYIIHQKKIAKSKVLVIKNGYYKFKIDNKIRRDITFLFNSTWIPRKGTALIYEAFNRLFATYPFVELIIAGSGVDKSKVLQGFNKEYWKNIEVIEKFTRQQEEKLYSEATIFLMPSFFEGQSLALVQAMAMGLCPVAADNCGQKDIIQSNVNGLLFKTGDITSFMNQLEVLMVDKSKVTAYGNEAKESVKEQTWENVAALIVSTCLEVVNEHNAEPNP